MSTGEALIWEYIHYPVEALPPEKCYADPLRSVTPTILKKEKEA